MRRELGGVPLQALTGTLITPQACSEVRCLILVMRHINHAQSRVYKQLHAKVKIE
jgi:hypothetical protein